MSWFQIRCCDVSPDDRLVVTGGRDKALRLFRICDGQMLCSVNMYEDIFDVAFALDGRMVVALIHLFGERRLAIFAVHGDTLDGATDKYKF